MSPDAGRSHFLIKLQTPIYWKAVGETENIPGASLYLHLHNCIEDQVSVSQLVMGQCSPVLHHLPPAAAVSDGPSSHQSLVTVARYAQLSAVSCNEQ